MMRRTWENVEVVHGPAPVPFRRGDVMAVDGMNFSGRTNLLRGLAGVENGTPDGTPAVYVGPEVHNAVSGLAASVRGELGLGAPWNRADLGAEILESIGMSHLLDRNPLLLSGGEQACVAIASGAVIGPHQYCIDGAFEQVGAGIKQCLLRAVARRMEDGAVYLCDNHLSDFDERLFTRVLVMQNYGRGSQLNVQNLNHPDVSFLVPARPAPLVVDNLRFSYGRMPVLQGTSFQLENGRVYLLEGRNGAGKSTLAKLLCGVLRPDAGTITVRTVPGAPWMSPGAAVGYHFQNPDLQLFAASVRDELSSRTSPQPAAVLRILKLLFGFDDEVLDSHPQDLSFVTRKRVALAATLANARPWLVLDEPTLGQDEDATTAIARIIGELARRGAGVIVISHSPAFKSQLDATALRLEEGIAWRDAS